MLMVRLQRVGRKHEPVFRLVLTDSKNGPKSGKFLEILGSYDARRGEKAEFKTERVKHWIANGAKLSDTVHNIFVERKIIAGKKINVLPKKSPIVSAPTSEGVRVPTESVGKKPAEEVRGKEEIAETSAEETAVEPEAEKVALETPV
ncbi:MAG: 30S ribosomal protein S16 [Candidatus Zambryskibacteria bacterium RIFCSPHIGHO2_01_FULL_39_63]|nr:MAG: 30S ribosomal protein S16 [Parcubacteria group bacterium GW2011_GWA1_38_7]OHA87263.1 MAG: 30S ribosomal protein S16 [Candidatus Zambryskibacteria bacterium RIFCSPHIGHO2_01_FULL_39_63]OHA98732.1 MAG: 30S ribosomal protein S16 [Candidatus Zambryskibacteria bacterium RIFCSPHIGHO2_12_FULL_39_21]